MTKQLVAFFLFHIFLSPKSFGFYENFDRQFVLHHQNTEIQVGILGPENTTGTLLYLPGFADTFDNHETLLRSFSQQGLKVITFDYPEHGESGGSIRWWGLPELAGIIPALLADPRAGFAPGSPLILAGWSTGATIAIRTAQAWQKKVIPPESRLAGIIAFAPALPARIVININKADLTNGEMKHDPQPSSVPVLGQFSGSITIQSKLASMESIPAGIPTLLLVAGDHEDTFAQSTLAARFVQRSAENVIGFQCTGAKHGLEFEPASGAAAKSLATRFAKALLSGEVEGLKGLDSRPCPRIAK